MPEHPSPHEMIRAQVVKLAKEHESTWADNNLEYWTKRLSEESHELIEALHGRHHHSPEREAVQLSATLMNFLAYRFSQFKAYAEAASCTLIVADTPENFADFLKFTAQFASSDEQVKSE